MILGAGTMRDLVEQLLPGAHFITGRVSPS